MPFVRKQKCGIFKCLNGHTVFTLSEVFLKICILAKSNTFLPFLEFIKSEL